jgi:hypothetical protein
MGGKGRLRVRLTTLPPSLSGLSIKYGNLDVTQAYGSLQPVTGIALTLFQKTYIFGPIVWLSSHHVMMRPPFANRGYSL